VHQRSADGVIRQVTANLQCDVAIEQQLSVGVKPMTPVYFFGELPKGN
jgi:hypothetical protein